MTTSGLRPVAGRLQLGDYLRELWGRRHFITTVPRHDLRAQHMDTLLGNIWFLADPILQTTTYFLIFGVLLKTDRGHDNFIVFLVVGVLTLGYFSGAIVRASKVMGANETLIRSIYFPRAAIPASSALMTFYTYVPSFLVMVIVALITGERPTGRWLLLPAVLGLLFLFVAGAVFLFARLGHTFRDVANIIPHGTRLLFYASGTIFDPRAFTTNPKALLVFELNPLYQFISLIRWCLLDQHIEWWFWISVPAWAIGLFCVGFVVFWQGELGYGSTRR